ncbi:MAG: CHASE4 domain-containing protein, partial [Anaerolineae bacterium]
MRDTANPSDGEHMSLRGKTLIFTGIVFTCAILVLYATSRTILLDGFVRLEEQSTSRNVERVLDALSNDLTNLNSVADDWAAWDDTYAFIENPNEDYIQSNLVNGTFTGLRLNFMLFIHSSGQLVFGKAFDLENEEEIPVPLSLLEHLSADCPFLRHPNPKSNIAGILLLPEGPMLIASRPIVTSESKGPVRGTLLMGRYFDSTEIERLAEITHLSLALQRFDDAQMPPDFQAAKASLSEETPIFVQPLNAETIAGYALLKDVYGKPALLLRADMPRDIYGQGQATTSYFLLSQLLVGLAFGATTLVLLERQVLSRLLSLSRSIRKIGASGNLSARVPAAGKDELGSLAGGINRMLEALEGAQRELQLNEKWLATTLKSIGDAVIATDAEGHVTFMNSVAESLTGWKQEEAVGKPVGDVFNIINEETGEQAENPVKRVMREGIVVGLANHTALIAKDGTKIPIDDCGAPIKDDEGNIMGAVLIFHDITERRRAEEALREAEAKYRTLVEQLPAITYIVGFGEVNRTVYISPQVESLLGFSQDEWLADPELWIKQIHPEDRERVLAEVRSRDASGESLDVEYRVLTR